MKGLQELPEGKKYRSKKVSEQITGHSTHVALPRESNCDTIYPFGRFLY